MIIDKNITNNEKTTKNFIVIFDYDGVLFDTSTVDIVTVNKTREHFGLPPLTEEVILNLIGLHTIDIVKACLPTTDIESINSFERLFTELEVEEVFKSGQLYEGVYEMLTHLKNLGIPMAICSNGSKEYLEANNKRFGLDNFFTRIWSEVEGITKSQATGIIMHEANASKGIFVGDREMDIKAGSDNGLVTICSTLGFGGVEAYGADFVVHTIEQMQSTICQVIEEFSSK